MTAHSESPAKTYPSLFQAWGMMAMLVLAYILSLVDRQIIALMVGPIRADLDISDFQIGLLQGFAFTLLYCSVGLPLGRIADKYSRKYLIIAGIVIWSIMTAFCGLAGSFMTLFIARVGVGFGEATLTPAAYSIIGDSFPPDQLVRANAVYAMAGLLGIGLSFMLGGTLVEYFASLPSDPDGLSSWQRVFLTLGAAGVPVALLWMFVREPARHKQKRDEVSSFTGALASLWQDRSRYAPYYLSACCFVTITWANFSWIPAHLGRAFAMSPSEIGLVIGISVIIGGILGVYTGPALTNFYAKRGFADGSLRAIRLSGILIAPTLIAPLLPLKTLTLVLLLLNFIALGALPAIVAAAIQLLTPSRLRAVNGALYVMAINVAGMAVGAAIIGYLSDNLFTQGAGGLGQSVAVVTFVSVALLIAISHFAIQGGRAAQDFKDALQAA